MAYSFGRKSDAYPLSLKDNCLLPYLRELDEMGVKCVKIEGRMKRPEYVAVVTEIYDRVIHEGLEPTDRDMERLRLAFSRDGFTDGYYTGEKRDMTGTRGEQDPEAERMFTEARPVTLTATDDAGHAATVLGPEPAPAQNAAVSRESVSAQLYKTGGTPYRCREVHGVIGDGLFLSAAALNGLRREALEGLTAQRSETPRRRSGQLPPPPTPGSAPERLHLNLQVQSAAQLTEALAETKPDNLYVPLALLCAEPELLRPFRAAGTDIAAVLPRVITDDELDEISRRLRQAAELGVDTALAGNLGHVALARAAGMGVRGDYGLNVFNSQSMQVLAEAGLRSVTASFELRLEQVRDLVKTQDTELILYGRLPCMVSDQDLIAQADVGDNPVLSDRMGSAFPVAREFGGRCVIWNAHKLFLADKMEDVLPLGLWGGRLMFTTESPRECVEVTKTYLGESKYQPNGLTRGLYYRGVE
jgi:putative protease